MSFEFGEKIIKQFGSDMEALTLASERREKGFIICQNKEGELFKRNQCTGGKCSIRLNNRCEYPETRVGTFHTHPQSKAFFSETDLIIGHVRDDIADCIGAVEKRAESPIREGHIRCFDVPSAYEWYKKHFKSFPDAQEEAVKANRINLAEKQIRAIA